MSAKSSFGVKEAFEGIIEELERADVLQKYGKKKEVNIRLSDLNDADFREDRKGSMVGRGRTIQKRKRKVCCKSQ